jgi:predicted nucleic acid-binding protein
MNIVVDSSFIMSSVLPDEQSLELEKIYDMITNNSYKAYAASIFYLECENVLISSIKRNRINKAEYENYMQLVSLLPIEIDHFSSSKESTYVVGRIAVEYDLTSYDASYLELAFRIDGKIATLDKKLADSCRKANIGLLLN